ncbi:MAG: CDP-alcohol phosphatidyltransferase family protein [Deltaproteobacteria bacterium]|nr:CDP-alcohol phosphatidyltransferase family protein [Deltaproteobacteria bacterium]
MSVSVILTSTDARAFKTKILGLSNLERTVRQCHANGFQVFLTQKLNAELSSELKQKITTYIAGVKSESDVPYSLELPTDHQYNAAFYKQLKEALAQSPNESILFLDKKGQSLHAVWTGKSSSAERESRVLLKAETQKISASQESSKLYEKLHFDEIFAGAQGWITRSVNKRISFFLTRYLVRTNITPNQITWFCLFLGVVGCALLLSASWGSRVFGAFLIQMSSVLDGCDGEVARLKIISSNFGAWLDTVVDDVVNNLMFICLYLGYFWETKNIVILKASLLASFASFGISFFLYHFLITHKTANAGLFRLSWANDPEENQSQQKSLFDYVKPILKRDFLIFTIFLFVLFDVRALLTIYYIPIWIGFVLYAVSFLYGLKKPREVMSA